MNRSLVKLHKAPSEDVQHKTFSDDRRFFLFLSDAPHLLKTCGIVSCLTSEACG